MFRAYQNAESEVAFFFSLPPIAENKKLEQGEPGFGNWILNAESLLSSCPRSHHGRPYLLLQLASAKVHLNNISCRLSYLDDIILHLTEALLFPFRVVDGVPFKVVDAFRLLATILVRRFESSRQPSDLESGIKYLRLLFYLPHNNTDTQLSRVSAELANALSFKTELDPNSEHDNIEEVLSLYLHCDPWDPSEQYTASVLSRLALAVTNRLSKTGRAEYFEQVVGYLREGLKLCRPKDRPELAVLLVLLLSQHSYRASTEDDYQEIMALYNEYLPLLPSGHYLQPLARMAITLVAAQATGSDESDSNEMMINSLRATLNCLPPGNQYRSMSLHTLAELLRARYERFGREECLREANLCAEQALALYNTESLQSLHSTDGGSISTILSLIHANGSAAALEEEIQRSHERVSRTWPGQTGHSQALLNSHLVYLMKYSHSNETADLEEAINYHQMLLSSTSNTFKDEVNMASNLQLAFMQNGREELLEKSIDICQGVLMTRPRQASHARLFRVLGISLSLRCILLGRLENVNESISMYKAAFETYTNTSDKFGIACFWAHFARHFKHPSTSLAYQNALSVMRDALTGPTVQTQHVVIRNLGTHMQIPLNYASFLIERGQLELAVEILEQGRAFLWSELRGLHSSADQLRKVDPALADKFRDVTKALEAVTTSLSPHEISESLPGTERGHEETDAFSHTLAEQRRILQDRQAIISQIRKLPGVRKFLDGCPIPHSPKCCLRWTNCRHQSLPLAL